MPAGLQSDERLVRLGQIRAILGWRIESRHSAIVGRYAAQLIGGLNMSFDLAVFFNASGSPKEIILPLLHELGETGPEDE